MGLFLPRLFTACDHSRDWASTGGRDLRLKVFTVEISGVGGLCQIERLRNLRQSVFVYSAGLLAQALVFSFTLTYMYAFGSPGSPFGDAIAFTFTFVNVVMFVINLIPRRSERSGLATDGSVRGKARRPAGLCRVETAHRVEGGGDSRWVWIRDPFARVCPWLSSTTRKKVEPKLEPIVIWTWNQWCSREKKFNEINGRGDRI
jgi:hypothetical protein